jgi:hypothetical protein
MFENNIVTKNDYLNHFGINLDLEVPKGDEPTNATARYIWRVENYCNTLLARYKEQPINDDNIQRYKNGVMLMIYHSLKVGFENLNGLTDEAFYQFRLGGFCNVPKGVIYGS